MRSKKKDHTYFKYQIKKIGKLQLSPVSDLFAHGIPTLSMNILYNTLIMMGNSLKLGLVWE
jgi:hypothetical protein